MPYLTIALFIVIVFIDIYELKYSVKRNKTVYRNCLIKPLPF